MDSCIAFAELEEENTKEDATEHRNYVEFKTKTLL
jgi:hypothetical protein